MGDGLSRNEGERKAPKVFNMEGDVGVEHKRMIGGNPTNVIEMTRMKYKWAQSWYRTSMNNFWVPENFPMTKDKTNYPMLKAGQRNSLDLILSFLITLDSVQVVNLPNINEYITAPEVKMCLALQTADEAIHSQSYSYILDSLCTDNEKDKLLFQWRDNPQLRKRVEYITSLYNEFQAAPEDDFELVKVCMANYILEGIYFYSAFATIYAMARMGLGIDGVVKEIRDINKDELTHVALFGWIFREMRNENPHLFTPEKVEVLRDMMRVAVEQEMEWAHYIINEDIEFVTGDSVGLYIKWLSNERMRLLQLEPLFPEVGVKDNPIPWVLDYADPNKILADFFESKPTAYSRSSVVKNDL